MSQQRVAMAGSNVVSVRRSQINIFIPGRTIEKKQLDYLKKIQLYEETSETVNEHEKLRESVHGEIVRGNLPAFHFPNN